MNQFAGNTVIASLKEHCVSRFPLPSYFCLTANEKDFSHSLEMTIRGGGGRHSTSFRWKEVPRRGGGWLPKRDERECEIVRLLVSSSKAELRGLNVIAAFYIGEETQNFFAVSLSHNLRFTGVQGRFLASLEMTIRGSLLQEGMKGNVR